MHEELPSQKGKTILLTGATSGIGLEAAVSLAAAGASLVIVGRDPTRTTQALAQIKARANRDDIPYFLCDFSSQDSIRKLAADFRARHKVLHVLVNNAGTVNAERKVTGEGIEETFAVNHLGYYLLTQLLLDLIVASAPARIVNVASVGHYRGTMDFTDLSFEHGYSIMKAYQRSKLGNVLFTRELARRLEGKNVTVNSLHPGGVATDIWKKAPGWAQPLLSLGKKLFMITPAEGSKTITYLATSPEVEGKTGLYFEKNRVREPSKLALDDLLAARLWDESARLVKLTP
jgi:NAD(P)-dependent dehydrogenase (short-subunit alcohol dehydrogenase family)